MLESINLSLASVCTGNCIFCPSNRGVRIVSKIMPFELAKRIIDEVASEQFRSKHNVNRFQVGENGDPFLNKELIPILRYIKAWLPEVKVILFTNFFLFTKELAEVILGENLIDSFRTNIDGSNKENFFLAKHLDLGAVSRNLADFLKVRKELKRDVPIHIGVITPNHYIKTIKGYLGIYPSKLHDPNLENVPDDFRLIKKHWEGLLDLKKDTIFRHSIFFWAERARIDSGKLDYKYYECTFLQSVKTEAYLAPDGSWYICCLDADNEIIFGNVLKQSIDEIYSGAARARALEMLEAKEFSKVGGPCKTVNCCEKMYYEPSFVIIIKRLLGRRLLSSMREAKRRFTNFYGKRRVS